MSVSGSDDNGRFHLRHVDSNSITTEALDPVLDSCIQELNNDEELSDIATSEQELIEEEFLRYFQIIRERFHAGIDEIQSACKEMSTVAEVCSLDSESSPIDVTQAVLQDLQVYEEKIFKEISVYLDGRFTKFRRSFQNYKKKTLEKLFQARSSIIEFKKVISLSSQRSAQASLDRMIEESEAQQTARIGELTTDLTRYRSAYEMASSKGTTLEMEKVELLENISRLEVRLSAAEERSNRANRRAVVLEDQVTELNRQIEELNTQKLLRQQMGNRKKTLGGSGGGSGSGGSSRHPSVSTPPNRSGGNSKRPFSSQCPKCIVLEDMLNELREDMDQTRRENEDLKSLQGQYQQSNEELHLRNEQLLQQQEAIRATAAAELEMAMKLIEQMPLADNSQQRQQHERQRSQTLLRVDTEPDTDSPEEGARVEEIEREDDREKREQGTEETNPSSIPVSRIQSAISMDKQLSAEEAESRSDLMATTAESRQNSFGAHDLLQETDQRNNDNPLAESSLTAPATSAPVPASTAPRSSVSVFPTKKEVISLTPVPIVMNAQFLEFERPPSRKQRPLAPAPVETSLPISPAVATQPAPSPMSFPSPSAYLQHYDYRPTTPDLTPLTLAEAGSPSGATAAQARRSSDPADYLTASQALEKQQRLSLRIQPVVAPDPTPPPGSSYHYDRALASYPHPSATTAAASASTTTSAGFVSPVDPSKKTVASEAYDNAMKLLNEALVTQQQLETENTSLKKSNAEAIRNVEEMAVYLKTQDNITILKIKERDLLLKELTEQVNELRAQVKRDQKLLMEVKRGNTLPVIETKRPPLRKVVTAAETSHPKHLPYKTTTPQLHKYDVTMEEMATTTTAARPATASGVRGGGLIGLDNSHIMTRPSSSPAFPTTDPASAASTSAAVPCALFPNRPVNLAQTLKVLCGSSTPGKPSLFESQGLGAYEYCEIGEATAGAGGDALEKVTAVKKEVTDLRKKITLLMAHQEIVLRRGRVGAHLAHAPSATALASASLPATPSGQSQRRRLG